MDSALQSPDHRNSHSAFSVFFYYLWIVTVSDSDVFNSFRQFQRSFKEAIMHSPLLTDLFQCFLVSSVFEVTLNSFHLSKIKSVLISSF